MAGKDTPCWSGWYGPCISDIYTKLIPIETGI